MMEWVMCSSCNGSGEGMYDNTTCRVCKGRGEVQMEVKEPEPELEDSDDSE